MTWNEAQKLGKRVFWEASTETIRVCPENYCVAARQHTPDGYTWITDWDGALRPYWPQINATIREYEGGSTAQALADVIAERVKIERTAHHG
jgi:hypothetical protein